MMLIGRFSLKFKQINLNMYQKSSSTIATANYMFKSLQTQPLVGQTMDNFLYVFDIPSVSQNWNTFAVSNKAINLGSENNFLAVSDNVINPITNLLTANVSSLNFAFAIEDLPANPPSISAFFYQLITNTLYIQLPNFRSLKEQVMNPIITNILNNYHTILIVNLMLLITIMCWVVWALYKHKKILMLKTVTYQLLQKLNNELIKEKQISCLKFHQKYSYI